MQLFPVAGQSETLLHCTQPRAALQTLFVVAQLVVPPATQAPEVLHVAALVNEAPLHEAPVQSVAALHWTQVTGSAGTAGSPQRWLGGQGCWPCGSPYSSPPG